MAKIDITKLSGYKEDMTPEEKVQLLSNYEVPEPVDTSGLISKSNFDKVASELAEAKRQLKAKMTEAEQQEAERATHEAEIAAELETLRKDKAMSENKSKFLGLGYSEKLAIDAAKALSENDMEKLFSVQKSYLEEREKAIKADLLNGTPKPDSNPKGAKTITKEQFAAMGYRERADLYSENKQLYDELLGGNE